MEVNCRALGSVHSLGASNAIAPSPLGARWTATQDAEMSARTEQPETPCPRPVVPPFEIGPVLVDPPVLQAPMAGFTNYPFRQLLREYGGVGLLAAEMVSARGFDWLDKREAEPPDRLWGVKEEPRPLAVQIWDNDPGTLASVGARLAHEYKVSEAESRQSPFGCR